MAKDKRTGFTFYRSYYEQLQIITEPIQRLAMYDALADYALNHIKPDLESGNYNELQKMFWAGVLPLLDKSWDKFLSGSDGGAPKGNTNACKDKTTKKQPKTTKKQPIPSKEVYKDVYKDYNKDNHNDIEGEGESAFYPPSLDDIKVYYLSKHGHPVNEKIASKFINYYAARGWNMGRSMMTDWHAAFEQWCAREDEYNDKHIQDNESTKQTTKQCCGEHGQQREQRTDEDGRNGKGRSLDEEVW